MTYPTNGLADIRGIVPVDFAGIDPWGRFGSSAPVVLFSSMLGLDLEGNRWTSRSSGASSAAYNTNQGSVTLTCGAGAGTDISARQSRPYQIYVAGSGLLVLATVLLGAAVTNLNKRVGLFDEQNGIFLELAGSTLQFTRRTFVSGSAVDTSVVRTAWNVDEFDGTGPSGVTLSLTSVNTVFFDVANDGRIRCGFLVNGIRHVAHAFNLSNSLTLASASRWAAPVRYEVGENGAASAGGTMVQLGSCVIGHVPAAVGAGATPNYADNAVTSGTATATLRSLLAVQLASGFVRGGRLSRFRLGLLNPSTVAIYWALTRNPTLGGALTFAAITGTKAEASVTQTTFTSSADRLASGYLAAASSLNINIPGDIVAGSFFSSGTLTADSIVLCVAAVSAAGIAFGSLSWLEE